MENALVVVESAAKAKTIERFLGGSFRVMASGGHVRDLPQRGLSVDIANGFRPQFEVVPDRAKILDSLKRAARKASHIYLATDPDREGEAISHDLAEEFLDALGPGHQVPIQRITFHEITPPAVRRALEQAGEVDANKVKAQQTRRVLDRIVGYKISPLLSRKVAPRLSAGRVQSVALRLICSREREIRAFNIEEYWTIDAQLATGDGASLRATAEVPKSLPRGPAVREEATARRIQHALEQCRFRVSDVEAKNRHEKAPPPFITSTMQRQAASLFRFPAARTMRAAQGLYEGVDLGSGDRVGLITYLRTDSTRVSDQALQDVRRFIGQRFGGDFLPERPNYFRKLKGAQDAHEAIRPTSVERSPDQVAAFLSEDQRKLYRMIWERFIASQMTPAVWHDTKATILAEPPSGGGMPEIPGFGQAPERLVATGSVLIERGYRVLYREAVEDPGPSAESEGKAVIPPLRAGQPLTLEQILKIQHFTAPPKRYSEASLIRKLEQNGIGRPSTYVPTLRKIKDREYVRTKQRVFVPTEVGMLVSALLAGSFDNLFNVRYTADMEENLDRIEQGEAGFEGTLEAFYADFSRDLEKAIVEMPRLKGLPTAEPCDRCGRPLVLRWSGGEKFLGCEGFPECRGSRSLTDPGDEASDEEAPVCPECGAPMSEKRGRFGAFLGCTRYPECTKIIQIRNGRLVARVAPVPVEGTCPECGEQLVQRQSRRGPFVGCSSFPKCRYIQPDPSKKGKKATSRKTAAKRGTRSRVASS